jgi:predicted phosphodiesterase
MTRLTQVEVYEYEEPLDYAPFLRLCDLIVASRPDAVVNLGDFTEPFHETPPALPDMYRWAQLATKVYKLAGNHDRADGADHVILDGVRYEHGHKLAPSMPGADASVDGYVARLRANTAGARLVHGHSHVPAGGPGLPLDVGSVTFSRTYGEVVGGVGRVVAL